MTKLQQQIMEASQAYYTDGTSKLSDAEFDKLLAKEKEINPNSPLLDIGHGYDVNKDTTYGEKANHMYSTVGSLPKIHTWQETTIEFKKGIAESDNAVVASLKLDGNSIALYYKDSHLVKAITRGNGTVGVDVTAKVIRILQNREGTTNLKTSHFTGAIRGEILMSYDDFEEFKAVVDPEADNPRNSAAGIINTKSLTNLEYLSLIVYTVIGDEDTAFDSYTSYIEFLTENFKNVVPYSLLTDLTEDNIDSRMNEFKNLWYNKYPADGIVLACNHIKHNNYSIEYNSMAYKFPTESIETTVHDVEWTMSKTGFYIPVVVFDPIRIEGSTVERASGFNFEYIRDNKIGKGSKIKVTKANLIIPYIEEVITQSHDIILPNKCPVCGEPFIVENKHLRCANPTCNNAKFFDALIWFKTIAPVDGLGDILIEQYLTKHLNNEVSVENIYKHGPFDDTSSKYVKEELFKKTFNSLFTNKVSLACAIKALNIPRFGDKNSEKLAQFADVVKTAVELHGTAIPVIDIGEANFTSLTKYATKLDRLNYIFSNIIWEQQVNTTNSKYSGKEIVITGKLSVKRSDFEAECKKLGFVVKSAVNKNTSLLITDDPEGNSSKNIAANKYCIPKISEKDFREQFLKN